MQLHVDIVKCVLDRITMFVISLALGYQRQEPSSSLVGGKSGKSSEQFHVCNIKDVIIVMRSNLV